MYVLLPILFNQILYTFALYRNVQSSSWSRYIVVFIDFLQTTNRSNYMDTRMCSQTQCYHYYICLCVSFFNNYLVLNYFNINYRIMFFSIPTQCRANNIGLYYQSSQFQLNFVVEFSPQYPWKNRYSVYNIMKCNTFM